MTPALRTFIALAGLALLTACGGGLASKFKSYDGPPITQVLVKKGERKIYLLSGNTALKVYDIGLGNEPVGHKQFEGDGKTPEGVYYIDRRNPNSRYHLSIGVSYPSPEDTARALAVGLKPGGDIFVHGQGPEGRTLSRQKRDWTAGCIAVRDNEIEEIYSMVRDGTPIIIMP